MIGEKSLNQVKGEIRDAFAKKGIDVETWLDQQMAKLKRGSKYHPVALDTLRLLREGLRTSGKTRASRRKAKKLNGKKKPAA